MSNLHSYTPLTPTTLLERSGYVFRDREAIVLGDRTISYGDLLQRSRNLARTLENMGIHEGSCVALLSDNGLHTFDAHFGIPATGGLIVSINPWLSTDDIKYQLEFCKCSVVIASTAHFKRHGEIFQVHRSSIKYVMLVTEDDIDGYTVTDSITLLPYEKTIAENHSDKPLNAKISSEMSPIAVNFTSGTTGRPKGVTYSHRAAYLQALGQVMMLGLNNSSRYFWSLPMFHGNGWFHIWANVAAASRNILLSFRNDEDTDFPDLPTLTECLIKHRITHLGGAPRLIRHIVTDTSPKWPGLTVMTGGAAPSPGLIRDMKYAGAHLIHQYGLNETCGAFVVCELQDNWVDMDESRQIELRSRQGAPALVAGTGLRVVDEHMKDVETDGKSLGEVIMAGNTVALEYYNNPEATRKSFKDGWFRSGDIAVVHPDGYIEIKDRIKDMIYVDTNYGWLNISSLDVEKSISRCPGIKDVAVVGVNHDNNEKNGTKLVAFVEMIENSDLQIKDIEKFCELNLGEYERPHHIVPTVLPKTATGKIKKHELETRSINLLSETV